MSFQLQHSRFEGRRKTRKVPETASANPPPFSFSTTIHRYGETDCDLVDRRHRVTVHLEGVRYYGYRYYNPELGRWVNRDPIGELDALNLHLFIHNSPTIHTDKNGLFTNRNKVEVAECLLRQVGELTLTYPVSFVSSSLTRSGKYADVLTQITMTIQVAGHCPATGGFENAPLISIPWGTHWLTMTSGHIRDGVTCRWKYKCAAKCKSKCCGEWEEDLYDRYIPGEVESTPTQWPIDPTAPQWSQWKDGYCRPFCGELEKERKKCAERAKKHCEGQERSVTFPIYTF